MLVQVIIFVVLIAILYVLYAFYSSSGPASTDVQHVSMQKVDDQSTPSINGQNQNGQYAELVTKFLSMRDFRRCSSEQLNKLESCAERYILSDDGFLNFAREKYRKTLVASAAQAAKHNGMRWTGMQWLRVPTTDAEISEEVDKMFGKNGSHETGLSLPRRIREYADEHGAACSNRLKAAGAIIDYCGAVEAYLHGGETERMLRKRGIKLKLKVDQVYVRRCRELVDLYIAS